MTVSHPAGGADGSWVAVIPVRHGLLPVGAAEVAAEAGGRCWLVGSGTAEVDDAELGPLAAGEVRLAELGPFAPARWAAWLAPRLAPADRVLLPHSPDGRDLAPRLAAHLDRPLISGAVRLGPSSALVARHGGLALDEIAVTGPAVATVQIGAGSAPTPPAGAVSRQRVVVEVGGDAPGAGPIGPGTVGPEPADPELLAELEADRATMDLADATRIVAAGAGLGRREELDVLETVAEHLGASVGATRVVTDWGWLPAERQIGTTGVMVHPQLYLAVGISGAVQHTAGLGHPAHIVAVNTDPSCPMMELADLALVCDGPAYLRALAEALAEAVTAGRQP
jgi:electron transfer flavoprotein alpha subunit